MQFIHTLSGVAILLGTLPAVGQADSAVYISGDLPTEYQANITLSDDSYGCTDTLTVNIPPGNYVTGVDVYYDMEALNPGWIADQGSYLEFLNTSVKEATVILGPGINGPGVYSYTRMGLSLANGISVSGELDFFLHAFRNFSQFPLCNNSFQVLKDSSWKIVVHHIPPPSCLPPSGLNVLNITSNSVQLNWNSGGASAWQLEYGPPGYTPGSGIVVNALANPATINGLNSNTNYDIYVRDSCAPGDVSTWVGPVNILTQCSYFTAPWVENFDGNTWISGAGAANAGNAIDQCWLRPGTNNPNFSTRNGPTASTNTGPSSDYSGSGNYIYTEASGSPGAGEIITPEVFIPTTLSQPALEFFYHMYGSDIDSLFIEVDNGSGFSTLASIVGSQQSSEGDPWLLFTTDLSAYAGDTVRIRFTGTNNGFMGDISLDEVAIKTVSCLPPTNLNGSTLSTMSVNLNWTTAGASNWLIGYRPHNSTAPLNIVPANSNPFTLTGLNPSTRYEFYVKDSCAVGDVSIWIGPVVVSTSCALITAPWSENFDGSNWISGTGGDNLGHFIAPCWIRPTGANPDFSTRFGPTTSANTGPNGDVSGSGNYLYTEASNGAQGKGEIITNDIYIPTSITNPQLNFMSHLYGASIDSLVVQADNGSGFTRIFSIVGEQQTSGADPWQLHGVSLAQFSGDTIKIMFQGTNSAFPGDIAIDEVSVMDVTCPKPDSLQLVSVTNNSITINWNTGGAAQWQIGYRIAGSAGALNLVSATSNPFTINGLAPDTEYEIWVRDSCSQGDVSTWDGPLFGFTDCDAIIAPWTEDFEGSDWVEGLGATNDNNQISSCWSRPSDDNPNFGTGNGTTPSNGTGPNTGFNGSNQYIYTEASGGGQGTGEITTPSIVVPNSLTNPTLSFYYHMFGNGIDSLEVSINSGSGYTKVFSRVGPQQSASNAPWLYTSYDLSAYLGDTIQIRFRGTNNSFEGDISIDQVVVDDAPPCPAPSNLMIDTVTSNSITISWNTGGASNWQLEYGPVGFILGQGTQVNINTNPYTLTGLIPRTGYEFYVRDSCGVGLLSPWSFPVADTTECGVFTAPFSENFDGADWLPGFGALNAGSQVSPCWTRVTGANPDFSVGTGGTASNGTGPNSDVSVNGNYLYTEASNGATGAGEILSPEIYIPASLSTANLFFDYHLFGGDIDSLQVSVDNGSGPNQIYSLVGQQQASSAAPWITATVNLDSYIGDTIQILFSGTNSGFEGDIAIDEFKIDTNSCPVPTNFQVVAKTPFSLTLNWTTGGASDWELRIGPPGFSLGSGTTYITSTKPFTITGLSSNTEYCIYLRDSCGPSNVSEWVNLCDRTDCAPFTAPWSEDFEGSDWVPGTGNTNIGNQISPCWLRPNANNPNFGTWTGPTASNNTGPNSDRSGNGQYIYTEASGSPGSGEILSPQIVIPNSMTSPRLLFWYHLYGVGIDSLTVEVGSGGSFNSVYTLSGEQQSSSNDAWQKASISLSSYVGDTVEIRFRGTNNNFTGDISIDEVSIEDITCPAPDSLQLSTSTSNSITVGWNSGGASNWQIAYRVLGSGAAYNYISTNQNPHNITGLSPATTYEIKVRDSCGVGDVSEWSGDLWASTLCVIFTAPWTENFDNGGWITGNGALNDGDIIGSCWIRSTNTGYRWTTGSGPTASFNTGPQGDFNSGGNYIYTEASGANGPVEIESPQVYLDSNLTNPKLEYYYHMYGQAITSLVVEVDNGGGYQNLRTITGQQQTSNAAPWILDTVSLSAFLGDTLRFRFTGDNTGFQGDIAIDQVSVTGTVQPCSEPTQISFSNVSTTTADVVWNSAAGSSELEVVPAGQPQGSGTIYTGATSPFTLTNLQVSTSYDVYIRDECGGIYSNWVDSNFTTLSCPLVTASFTHQNNILTVNFDATSTVAADSLVWLFGDGNTGSGMNPSHSYLAAGSYSVSLIGWNACGNYDTLTQTIQVCDTLFADFSINAFGDSVLLDASASTGASQYNWDMGNGLVLLSFGDTLTHTFNTSGTKTITLTAVNPCGDTMTVTKTVKICQPPVADWTYYIIATTGNGMQVQFDGSNSQNASSYEWDFGDGNTATGAVQPVHTYVTPGLFYIVSLTVTNDCGDKNTRRFRLSQIGLEEADLAGIKLFPNPADDRLILEWNKEDLNLQKVELADVSGKVVLSRNIDQNSGEMSLNLSDLVPGYYSANIFTSGAILRYKLLVK